MTPLFCPRCKGSLLVTRYKDIEEHCLQCGYVNYHTGPIGDPSKITRKCQRCNEDFVLLEFYSRNYNWWKYCKTCRKKIPEKI